MHLGTSITLPDSFEVQGIDIEMQKAIAVACSPTRGPTIDDVLNAVGRCLTWLGRALARQALESDADYRTRHLALYVPELIIIGPSVQDPLDGAEHALLEATIAAERAHEMIGRSKLQAALDGMFTASHRIDETMTALHVATAAAVDASLPPTDSVVFATSHLAALLDTQGVLGPPCGH